MPYFQYGQVQDGKQVVICLGCLHWIVEEPPNTRLWTLDHKCESLEQEREK